MVLSLQERKDVISLCEKNGESWVRGELAAPNILHPTYLSTAAAWLYERERLRDEKIREETYQAQRENSAANRESIRWAKWSAIGACAAAVGVLLTAIITYLHGH